MHIYLLATYFGAFQLDARNNIYKRNLLVSSKHQKLYFTDSFRVLVILLSSISGLGIQSK